MNNPTQHRNWILGIRGRAAGAALVLAFMLVPAVLATGSAQAQTFTTLHSFDGTDGDDPWGALVQGTNGNFYGTTVLGGANNNGTVFEITPSGTLTTLYSFCSQSSCADGANPIAALVQATNGNFYGTTVYGGANNKGTVFEITPSGTLTTLYSFCSQSSCADGANPNAALVQATDGSLYGTTEQGGANNRGVAINSGTVFEITPSGALTTLYTFCLQSPCTDGYWPIAGLVQGTDGNFYGTTAYGGANGVGGTVFKITPSGTLTTLYNFCAQSGCTDGDGPSAGLVQGTDGNFYGTTALGGAQEPCGSGGSESTCGTVFKITPSGTLTTLYSFCSQSSCADGDSPRTALVQATDGNLYGTTFTWGASGGYGGAGTVFKITLSGTLTTLQAFWGPNGANPLTALVQGTDGNLYGTTAGGGANNKGTVFSLSMAVTKITLSPTSLTFAKQLVGTTSSAKTIKLTNSGTGTLTISNIIAIGNFTQTNNCPETLAVGDSCTVSVTFTPTVLGSVSGAISFYNNASGSPQVARLSGTGVAAVSVTPASLSFGTVNVGTTTTAKTVTVTNNSAASVSLTFTASSDYAAAPGPSNGCGATLAAKANCTIAVTFSPTQSGAINGSLAVSGSGFATQMVALTGSGSGGPTATLSFIPATASITNQLIGTTSAPKVVTITNKGTTAVTIASLTASAEFTAVGSGATPCGGTLAAGAKCTFSVTFTPSVTGSIKGSVTIANNSPISPVQYSVLGSGVLPVSFSPTSLTFAAQAVGTTSAPKTVTLTNNQTVLLNITSIEASGDYAAIPSGTTPCGASVAPKGKCTFQVTFTPTVSGTIKGAVDIAHDAPGSPQVVGLSGTGQ